MYILYTYRYSTKHGAGCFITLLAINFIFIPDLKKTVQSKVAEIKSFKKSHYFINNASSIIYFKNL